MKLKQAMRIVLNLAENNALDIKDVDGDKRLKQEAERQQEAIEIMEAYLETMTD